MGESTKDSRESDSPGRVLYQHWCGSSISNKARYYDAMNPAEREAREKIGKAYDEAWNMVGEVVDWLVEQGFPYDWKATAPAPRFLRDILADTYAARFEQSRENVAYTLDLEQEWRDA